MNRCLTKKERSVSNDIFSNKYNSFDMKIKIETAVG